MGEREGAGGPPLRLRLPQDLLGEHAEEVARPCARDARRPAVLGVGPGALLVCWLVVAGARRDRDGLALVLVLVLTTQVVTWLPGTDVGARRPTTLVPEGLLVRTGPVRRTCASWAEVRDVRGGDRRHDRARALLVHGREVDLPGLGADDAGRLAADLQGARSPGTSR